MQTNQTLNNNNNNQLLSNLYHGTKKVINVVTSFLKASFDVLTGKVKQSHSPNTTVRNSYIVSQVQTDLKDFNHYIYNRHGGYKALAIKVYTYLKNFIVNTVYPFISKRVQVVINDITRSEESNGHNTDKSLAEEFNDDTPKEDTTETLTEETKDTSREENNDKNTTESQTKETNDTSTLEEESNEKDTTDTSKEESNERNTTNTSEEESNEKK